jgi:hypothetical protein
VVIEEPVHLPHLGLQLSQVLPLVLPNFPSGQVATQLLPLRKYPSEQSEQVFWSVHLEHPEGQSEQALLARYLPSTHPGLHAVPVRRLAGAQVEHSLDDGPAHTAQAALQARHTLADESPYCPAGQAVMHCFWLKNVPLGQAVHSEAFSHSEQDLSQVTHELLLLFVKVLAGHCS